MFVSWRSSEEKGQTDENWFLFSVTIRILRFTRQLKGLLYTKVTSAGNINGLSISSSSAMQAVSSSTKTASANFGFLRSATRRHSSRLERLKPYFLVCDKARVVMKGRGDGVSSSTMFEKSALGKFDNWIFLHFSRHFAVYPSYTRIKKTLASRDPVLQWQRCNCDDLQPDWFQTATATEVPVVIYKGASRLLANCHNGGLFRWCPGSEIRTAFSTDSNSITVLLVNNYSNSSSQVPVRVEKCSYIVNTPPS